MEYSDDLGAAKELAPIEWDFKSLEPVKKNFYIVAYSTYPALFLFV